MTVGGGRVYVAVWRPMGRNLMIAGTSARAGKSIVACALGFAFRARGLRVGVMKPVAIGCERTGGALDPADIRGVALAAGCTTALELVCPYRYTSRLAPAAASEADRAAPPDLARIGECYRQIAEASDIVLVESVEGIADPITWRADSADLAAQLGLDAVVVVANRPGCVGAARMTVEHARSRGVGVAGWLLNDADADAADSRAVADAISRWVEAPALGAMRFKEPLGLAAVEMLLARSG